MKYQAVLMLAIAALNLSSMPPALAHSHNRWQNARVDGCVPQNCYLYNSNPYPNGVMAPNGTWVDGSVGADGYPAWMGGYRPR